MSLFFFVKTNNRKIMLGAGHFPKGNPSKRFNGWNLENLNPAYDFATF